MRSSNRPRWNRVVTLRQMVPAVALLVGLAGHTPPVAAAPVLAKCTATSGYFRWGGGSGEGFPRMNLLTSPDPTVDNPVPQSYIDALRQTEAFREVGVSVDAGGSRSALDATMNRRFTTGPQPWGVAYAAKRSITLANFVDTAGDVDSGFVLGDDCVPDGATILSAKVRVTHAILDPNNPRREPYRARIGVDSGTGFAFYELTGANLVNAGDVPSNQTGVENEVTTDNGATPAGAGDIDVTAQLSDAAKVNGAVLQFQAMRNGPAMRTIHNEISLLVEYEGGCTSNCDPPSSLRKLFTGGGFVALDGGSGRQTGNFGLNARSSELGSDVGGWGNFEYNDSNKVQMKGRITTIIDCSTAGASFTVSGTYTGRKGNTGWTSGTFNATVIDNGEPGKGEDVIGLSLAPGIPGFTGFTPRPIGNGNLQFHFCDLP